MTEDFTEHLGLLKREKERRQNDVENKTGNNRKRIQKRLRKLHDTDNLEKSMQIDLSHGIILVGNRHADEVKDALKNKPGLKTRTIIFDENVFNRRSNQAFKTLTTTKEGLELLKAAQLGVCDKNMPQIDGIQILN